MRVERHLGRMAGALVALHAGQLCAAAGQEITHAAADRQEERSDDQFRDNVSRLWAQTAPRHVWIATEIPSSSEAPVLDTRAFANVGSASKSGAHDLAALVAFAANACEFTLTRSATWRPASSDQIEGWRPAVCEPDAA